MSPIFQTIFLVGTFFAASYKQDDSSLSQFSLVGFFFEGTRENILPIFRASATGEQIELFPTWRDVDDRFFFNRAMVEELIEIGDQKLDAWITPFIQVCTKLLLGKKKCKYCLERIERLACYIVTLWLRLNYYMSKMHGQR